VREFIPHKYQLTAINHVINVPKCGLFLDMGLGKTVSTLTAIKELKYKGGGAISPSFVEK